MKKKFMKLLPYLIIIIFVYYCLPFLFNVDSINRMLLLLVIPTTCFFLSFFHGLYNKKNIWLSIYISLLFIPAYILIYFDISSYASNYQFIIIYFVLSLVGNYLGNFFK